MTKISPKTLKLPKYLQTQKMTKIPPKPKKMTKIPLKPKKDQNTPQNLKIIKIPQKLKKKMTKIPLK